MTDGWRDAELGDVVSILKGKKPRTTTNEELGLPYLVAEHLRGGSAKQWVVDTDGLVTSFQSDCLLLWDGAGAGDSFAGCEGVVASTMARLRPKNPDQLSGEYLTLMIGDLEDSIKLSNRGTTVPHVSPEALKSLPVRIPPLSVQRRIVNLITHLDNNLAALNGELATIESCIDARLNSWNEHFSESPTVPLSSLCSPRSGPSWAAVQESSVPSEGSVRVVKITNTRPNGRLDMMDETHVVGIADSTIRLSNNSLILIRTNGNRSRIGNVYRPNPLAVGCVVSAFQFAAELKNTSDRDWLYWWLKAPDQQQAMTDAASGSTGLGNLASGWLKMREVPWPDECLRREWLLPLEALSNHTVTVEEEVSRLTRLRSALLSTLLSGEIALSPGCCEHLIGGVA